MIKRFLTAFSVSLVAVLGLFSFLPGPSTYAVIDCPASSGFLAFPNWYRGLKCDGDANAGNFHVVMEDIPGFVWTIVLNAIDILLQVVGILAVVMILVSAFRYLTNGGSEEKIRSAKTSILQAVIGLLIAVSASTLIGFIVAGLSP